MSQQDQSLGKYILQLPLKQRVPVAALSKLLAQRQQIDNEQQQSITRIKQSYQQKLKPLLQRASEIIQGGALRVEELNDSAQYTKPKQNIKSYLKGKVIPGYWNGVLTNSPLVDEVNQNDEKVINYLVDVQNVFSSEGNENQGTSLKFVFKQNPYFGDTQITRHLRITSGQMLALQGPSIAWKQGKWLTHQKKKISNKKTGQSKIQQGKKIKSFFDIFLDCTAQNPKQLSRVGNFIIELGSMIVMDSLDYFLGMINCDEHSDGDEDGDGDGDGDEDEEEDEEEEMETGKKVKEN